MEFVYGNFFLKFSPGKHRINGKSLFREFFSQKEGNKSIHVEIPTSPTYHSKSTNLHTLWGYVGC
jgi:hypothetical protein